MSISSPSPLTLPLELWVLTFFSTIFAYEVEFSFNFGDGMYACVCECGNIENVDRENVVCDFFHYLSLIACLVSKKMKKKVYPREIGVASIEDKVTEACEKKTYKGFNEESGLNEQHLRKY